MTIEHGYGYKDLHGTRAQPVDDPNTSDQTNVSGQAIPPVTMVIPGCGHTYFIQGHVFKDSPLVTSLCRGCQNDQPLREAGRNWDETKYTLERPGVPG